MVTVFHELSHHVTKMLFNCKMTPLGCGPGTAGTIAGESGALAEEFLVGGIVSVLWRDDEVGNVDKIEGLVLEYRGGYRKISLWL